MSAAPFSLMLLVPTSRAVIPPASSSFLRWTRQIDAENMEIWEVCPEPDTPAQLKTWRQAEQTGEDAPLVHIEQLEHDQHLACLPEHVVLRCSLTTSGSGYVRPPYQSREVARQVVETLGATFAWSTSQDALNLPGSYGFGKRPWASAHSTMIFSDRFLHALRLDPTDLEDHSVGGDVFRLQRFSTHLLAQSPEGLGNESAALNCSRKAKGRIEDQALYFTLQRVSSLHQDAVQRWLEGRAALETPGQPRC